MATAAAKTKKPAKAAASKKAPAPKPKPPAKKASSEVCASRQALAQMLVEELDIGAEDLAKKLASFKLSASTLKTMGYHSRDTIRAPDKSSL
jgi:hypothetical protein